MIQVVVGWNVGGNNNTLFCQMSNWKIDRLQNVHIFCGQIL